MGRAKEVDDRRGVRAVHVAASQHDVPRFDNEVDFGGRAEFRTEDARRVGKRRARTGHRDLVAGFEQAGFEHGNGRRASPNALDGRSAAELGFERRDRLAGGGGDPETTAAERREGMGLVGVEVLVCAPKLRHDLARLARKLMPRSLGASWLANNTMVIRLKMYDSAYALATFACCALVTSAASPSRPIASLAVPTMANSVADPASSPLAVPTSSLNSQVATKATTTIRTTSTPTSRPQVQVVRSTLAKNCGATEKPRA